MTRAPRWAWRFPRYNNEIKNGAQADRARGPTSCVRVSRWQLPDRFQPGHYQLTTEALPLLATLQGWKARVSRAVPQRGLLHQHPPGHPTCAGATRSRSSSVTKTSAWCRCGPTACAVVRIRRPGDLLCARSSARTARWSSRRSPSCSRRLIATAFADLALRLRLWRDRPAGPRTPRSRGSSRPRLQEGVDDEVRPGDRFNRVMNVSAAEEDHHGD